MLAQSLPKAGQFLAQIFYFLTWYSFIFGVLCVCFFYLCCHSIQSIVASDDFKFKYTDIAERKRTSAQYNSELVWMFEGFPEQKMFTVQWQRA